MSNATAAKIPAVSIAITRAEGPARLCRTRTFKTWKNAHAALLAAVKTYPAGGGYDKHDLLVTFADGETYKGRLDCKADGSDTDPAQHIRDAVAFMAGNRCPAHWDAEKYHAHIKENLADAAEALAFLATYEV
jgi:hypothetical protein